MRKIIGPPLKLADGRQLPLSRAIATDAYIFVSGQLGLDCAGRLVPGGIGAQVRQAIANIQALLAEDNLTLENVVKVTGWLVAEGDFAEFNHVYAEFFTIAPPARSIVLSQLLVPGALIELEVIAARE